MKLLNKLLRLNSKNIFEQLNIEERGFQIVVNNFRNENELKHYYLDDYSKFKEIKSKWKFSKAEDICRGGYDYSLNILQKGEIKNTILICFSCNRLSIQSKEREIKFDNALFRISLRRIKELFKEDFIPLKIVKKNYSTRKEAIKNWNKEQQNLNLIKNLVKQADWMEYEGTFTVNFKIEKLRQKKEQTEKRATKELEQIIENIGDYGKFKFKKNMVFKKDEQFEFVYMIWSSEKLYNKFTEIKPEMLAINQSGLKASTYLKKWKEFSRINLELYYKNS